MLSASSQRFRGDTGLRGCEEESQVARCEMEMLCDQGNHGVNCTVTKRGKAESKGRYLEYPASFPSTLAYQPEVNGSGTK